MITNTENGKRYIGSSCKVVKRWAEHKSALNSNRHENPYLQNSWNKYGGEKFKFELIERVINRDLLLEIEQYYLDSFNPEYNIQIVAGSSNMSKESRAKVADALSKDYIIRFPDGHEEKIRNLREWCRNNQVNFGGMRQCLVGKAMHHKQYRIRYADDVNFRFVAKKRRKRMIYMVFPNGTECCVINLVEFSKIFGGTPDGHRGVIRGKSSHCDGFKCRYLDEKTFKFQSKKKRYILLFEDGAKKEITGLANYCLNNNIPESTLRLHSKKGIFFKGIRLKL